MEEKPLKKKNNRKKWLLGTGIGIIALILIFPLALDFYLQRKLPDVVNTKTPYRLKLKDFNLSLLSGNFTATDLTISTKNPADTKITQINGTVKKIQIRDFGIWKALFSKAYHADQFLLYDAQLRVKLAPKKAKDTAGKAQKDIHVNNIELNNIFADVTGSDGRPVFQGKDINVRLKDIRQSDNDAKIPLAFKEFKVNASAVKIGVNDFYEINADRILAADKTLDLQKFHLKPTQKPQQYNAKNVFDFSSERLLAKDFAISQDSLIVSDVIFNRPDLKVMSTGKNTVEKEKNPKEIEMKIGMKNIDFQKGKIMVLQANQDRTASVDNFNFKLSNIVFDKNTVKEKIPFRFTNHDIEADNIYFKASPFQALKIKKISSNNADIMIEQFEMLALGKSADKDLFNIRTDQIRILNNRTKYVGQKLNILLGGIDIQSPDIKIVSATRKAVKKSKKNTADPDFTAQLGFLNISKAKITQIKQGKTHLAVAQLDARLDQVTSGKEYLKNGLPFKAAKHLITARNINLDAGKYYSLKVGDVKNSGNYTEIRNLAYLPKYSRAAFSRVIAKETDLYTIRVKKIGVTDRQSELFKNPVIDISQVNIDGIHCNIYHDLAPPDDNSARYLFSKKLRGVKIPLFVKNINITNSNLEYEENAENNNIPGKITFNDFNGKISDVNNAKIKGRPTTIKADVNFAFYNNASTDVHWKFDVSNPQDQFTINGKISKLSADNVNLFVRPYLNVTLDGKIDYIKFDYYGSNAGIAGKFYFKYSDMYVNLLNKKGNERKLLSTVANWFVKNESTGEPEYVLIEKKRDPERSFFNMLWQGIMEGLKKYVI